MARRHQLPGAKNGSGIINHVRNIAVYGLYLVGALIVLGVALGGGGDTTDNAPAPETTDNSGEEAAASGNTETETAIQTQAPAQTQTATPTQTQTEASSSDQYHVRVTYSGEWSGSVGAGSTTRSIDGMGTTVIDIQEQDPSMVSATIQKSDAGSGTLTVEIIQGSEVVKQTSTSAEYGVASVSYSAPIFGDVDGGQAASASH